MTHFAIILNLISGLKLTLVDNILVNIILLGSIDNDYNG